MESAVTISAATHRVVKSADDTAIFDATGRFLIEDIETADLMYVDVTEKLMDIFNLTFVMNETGENNLGHEEDSECSNAVETETSVSDATSTFIHDTETSPLSVQEAKVCKVQWSHNATLGLIGQYADHTDKFLSTTSKNDRTWGEISTKLKNLGHNFTVHQCKDKFKYLKRLYMKKVDNMRLHKNSGAAVVNFTYFEQMDEIFGKKPNVKPKAIASSSRGNSVDQVIANTGEDSYKSSAKKRKLTPKQLADKENEKTEERNRRHDERIAVQKLAISTFKEAFEVLTDTMNEERRTKVTFSRVSRT